MYKFCKFCKNRARDTPLQGVYIPHFGQILVQISVLGVLYPYLCTDGVKFGTEEGTAPPCQISPPSVQHYHSSAFRMEIIIIGKFSLTISAILAAILDSEKATRVASG